MTAITRSPNHQRAEGRTESTPLHALSSATPHPDGNERRNFQALSSSDAVSARSRFFSTVTRSVAELVERGGYNRERATALLMRQIQERDKPPCDQEVFKLMALNGMKICEASIVLTVGRALKRIRSEREMTYAEAIDELTAKIKTDTLPLRVVDNVAKECKHARPLLSMTTRKSPFSTTSASVLKNSKRLKTSSSKCATRKRLLGCSKSGSDDIRAPSKKSIVPPNLRLANNVNVGVVQKAILAVTEEGSTNNKMETRAGTMRTKRNVSQLGDQQAQQTTNKRQRVGGAGTVGKSGNGKM